MMQTEMSRNRVTDIEVCKMMQTKMSRNRVMDIRFAK